MSVETLADLVNGSSVVQTPSPTRLQSLFTFTSQQRLSNAAGYDANVLWWSIVIKEALREGLVAGRAGDRLTLRIDDGLVDKLRWQGGSESGTVLGKPKGIAGVLASLRKPGKVSATLPTLLPLSDFLSLPHPLHQPPSLASRFIARPLWWALSKVNPLAADKDIVTKVDSEEVSWKSLGKNTVFVHLELLEETAKNIISDITTTAPALLTSRLFTAQTFQRSPYALLSSCLPSRMSSKVIKAAQSEERLSLGDCKVVLRYLERDKKVMVTDAESQVYKLIDSPEEAVTTVVTEADKGTVAIMSTLTKLEDQITEINDQILAAKEKAAQQLKLNHKNVALSYLRSRKQLEGVLEKRVGATEQLKSVLRGIEQAHGDVEIMAAYETSTATLRKVLAHPSLQMSHVDSTMDNLAEALADQLEIDEAIQSGGKAAVSAGTVPRVDLDDDVLAAELEELMKEDEKQNEGEKKKQEEGEKEKEAEGHPTGTKVTEPGSRESGYERQATKIREQSRPSDGPDWKAIDEAATARKEEEERRAAAERLRKEANRPAMITDSG